MSPLVPCPSCSRHVRSSEPACPFCASALPTDLGARAVPAAPKRLDRLAAFTFAATLAVTGCAVVSGGDDSEKSEGEIGAIQPMYGMPPPPPAQDSGSDGGAAPCDDGGGIQAMYGAPPVDLPPPCPVEESDAGAIQPMYGMPAPEDAGPADDGGSTVNDGGGIQPMYGMPAGNGQ